MYEKTVNNPTSQVNTPDNPQAALEKAGVRIVDPPELPKIDFQESKAEGQKDALELEQQTATNTALQEEKAQKKKKLVAQNELPFAESDLADLFVAKHKDTMRFCHDTGRWYLWNGKIWERETKKQSLDIIRNICKDEVKNAGIKERKGLLRDVLFKHVDSISQTDPSVAVTSEIWDNNKYLLGTPDGTVDLQTGILRQAKPQDFITKSTLIIPHKVSYAPIWKKFLNEATNNDLEFQHFLQQICGMILTGDTTEHALFFIHGPGGNGKSVFLTVITEILNDYATAAAMETFINSKYEHHPTELAKLCGARLVTASETEDGRYWAESKIKQLTGGDKITARYMRQDFFDYIPQFKLIIIGNHKPNIRTMDEAIKRRINIIPFTQKPKQIDLHLNEKLKSEYPQILRWMIEGCLDWQKNGLQRPQCVKIATENYFADQDIFSQWIAECCEVDPIFSGQSSDLFNSWKKFAELNGILPGNSKTFSNDMEKRGFSKFRTNKSQRFKGLCLKKSNEEKN